MVRARDVPSIELHTNVFCAIAPWHPNLTSSHTSLTTTDGPLSNWRTSNIVHGTPEIHSRHARDTVTAQDCPFCDDWATTLWSRQDPKGKTTPPDCAPPPLRISAQRFKRYVGRHHEQLAIFAMPRWLQDEGSGSSKTASSCGSVAHEDGDVESDEQEAMSSRLYTSLYTESPNIEQVPPDQRGHLDSRLQHLIFTERQSHSSESPASGRIPEAREGLFWPKVGGLRAMIDNAEPCVV